MSDDQQRGRATPAGRTVERLSGGAAAGLFLVELAGTDVVIELLALVEPGRLACLLVPVFLVELCGFDLLHGGIIQGAPASPARRKASPPAGLPGHLSREQHSGGCMVVHFNTVLFGREFGAHLLSVEKFQNWLDQKGLEVPLDPPLSHSKFIQVEALLCAIERGANAGITDGEAAQVVQQIDRLSGHEYASLVPQWLLGAEAHWNWRERIRQAVKDGELQLLDFVSKLPLSSEIAPEPAAQVKPVSRFEAQEAEILAAIRAAGHDPLSVPKIPPGARSGIKAVIRGNLVGKSKNFPKNGSQFDKAWARLRAAAQIVD